MLHEGATRRGPGPELERDASGVDHPAHLVARECWYVGVIAAVVAVVAILAVGRHGWVDMYRISDSPYFLNVARQPFGNSRLSDNPMLYGVAYRYGRIGFPLAGWLLAFGRPSMTPTTLLTLYVVTTGAWVALAAEHLRRAGRRPMLALLILALPNGLLSLARPIVVADPMAGALVFAIYLLERDGRRAAVYVAAAVLILTREPMALALVPLVWHDWKQNRRSCVRRWGLVLAPYLAWLVWVRFRIGQFPFQDPSVSRRDALGAPFAGMWRVWGWSASSVTNVQHFGICVALATLVAAVVVARTAEWRYPLTHGALALCALIPFLGISVFFYPAEALRVLAPMQALLLVAALDRGGSITRPRQTAS